MTRDAAAKEAWLEAKRAEHERNSRRRSAQGLEGMDKAVEPDDAALKQEWLRQRRREHEMAMVERERISSDLEAIGAAAAPPIVDAALLSTPTERELYIRNLEEQRHNSQRERQRMAREAERRPSINPYEIGLDGSFSRGRFADERPTHKEDGIEYDQCYSTWRDQGDTSAANSTTTSAAEREVEEMAELEIIESLHLQVRARPCGWWLLRHSTAPPPSPAPPHASPA